MLSKRLKAIALLVPKNDNVIDIGCDHALLDIYLTLYNNNICVAADISEKVIENAKKNILKYNLQDKIKTIVSDGINNIEIEKNSTIVISGMGTYTILDIVSKIDKSKINKLIIQSNNNLYELRKKINDFGYEIELENVVYDKNKYYTIIVFKKGNKKYKNKYLKYGVNIIKNEDYKKYINYLIDKNSKIYSKLNNKYLLKKIKLKYEKFILKKFLNG